MEIKFGSVLYSAKLFSRKILPNIGDDVALEMKRTIDECREKRKVTPGMW